MITLGISFGYHDSNVAIVRDGVVVSAVSEERLSRIKHDSGFPMLSVEHCLNEAGVTLREVDQIVYHEDPFAKFSRVLTASSSGFPFTRKEFVESMKSWLSRKLWTLGEIQKRLDIENKELTYLAHHFSHGAQAFMGSGFDEAAIVIVDAVGDWSCSAIYKGKWVDGKPEIKRIREDAFPNSLGLVYSAVTAYLGFEPNDSECSTMALAGFGKPVHLEKFRKILGLGKDGHYSIDRSYFNFVSFYRNPWSKKFEKEFGSPRKKSDRLSFNVHVDEQKLKSSDEGRWADIACSLQLALEECLVAMAREAREITGSSNLCLAGGVAYNCVATSRIWDAKIFSAIHIPSDPGDGGTAVGAALYAQAQKISLDYSKLVYRPYLGPHFSEEKELAMLPYINPSRLRNYQLPGVREASSWNVLKPESEAELIQIVATHLKEGAIVGWFQGRSELGPRALGNRSILVRPDDVNLASRLSKNVKARASFRPYALSVSAGQCERALTIEKEFISHNRWMQYAVKINPAAREQVRAAIHADDTTRPQICFREDNPLYHDLLEETAKLTGIPGLLNTSFNASGYPIVSTPTEALSMFARTDMDLLVLNHSVIVKERRN